MRLCCDSRVNRKTSVVGVPLRTWILSLSVQVTVLSLQNNTHTDARTHARRLTYRSYFLLFTTQATIPDSDQSLCSVMQVRSCLNPESFTVLHPTAACQERLCPFLVKVFKGRQVWAPCLSPFVSSRIFMLFFLYYHFFKGVPNSTTRGSFNISKRVFFHIETVTSLCWASAWRRHMRFEKVKRKRSVIQLSINILSDQKVF